MAGFDASIAPQSSLEPEIWQELKGVIATSSGFQRWQLEKNLIESSESLSLDQRVRGYLRETLETLAY